jgi:hypothetical protein
VTKTRWISLARCKKGHCHRMNRCRLGSSRIYEGDALNPRSCSKPHLSTRGLATRGCYPKIVPAIGP